MVICMARVILEMPDGEMTENIEIEEEFIKVDGEDTEDTGKIGMIQQIGKIEDIITFMEDMGLMELQIDGI